MVKLQIGTASYDGLVTVDYMTSMVRLMHLFGRNGLAMSTIVNTGSSMVTRARNSLLSRFLYTSDATHFMFIDADISFEPTLVHRMLTFDEDVVAGMYPRKVMRWDAPEAIRQNELPESAILQYTGLLCDGDEYQRRGPFVTARHCGAGFMMVKRRVVERLVEAHPESVYNPEGFKYEDSAKDRASFRNHALFDCMIDPKSSEYLGDDLAFCHRWRALGGTIWLDVEGSLVHAGQNRFVGHMPADQMGIGGETMLIEMPN
jgi:hypothetical protein